MSESQGFFWTKRGDTANQPNLVGRNGDEKAMNQQLKNQIGKGK